MEPGPSVDIMGELEDEELGPLVVLELELVPPGLLVLLDELVLPGLTDVLVLPDGELLLPLVLPEGELLVLPVPPDTGPSDIDAVVVSLVCPPGLTVLLPVPELVV